MNKYHLLLLSIVGVLTACGGGGGASATLTQSTSVISQLKYQYSVSPTLASTVKKDKTYPMNDIYVGYTKSLTIGNKKFKFGDTVDFSGIPLGYTKQSYSEKSFRAGSQPGEKNKEWTHSGHWKIYNMPYSILAVAARENTTGEVGTTNNKNLSVDHFIGYYTTALPNTGKAEYKGVGFDATSKGDLVLTVNFASKTVQGSITGLDIGTVTLDKGIIGVQTNDTLTGKPITYLTGSAKINGDPGANANNSLTTSYYGYFYGPNAEEVIGQVDDHNHNDLAGFAGQRGKITP